ncbi:MAG: dTMP kinase [Achromobacter sp.]|jgi:dTMP kinase|uniref:Thymidylate kinase n=2 Tax=Achromobacter TaxID=222 RepID=A0A6J5IMJ9_9BURK|nr:MULTISPECIES: dTMP kinase [Achromobacter]MBN9638157.1 dTMP kinase [Achromobacter sp.]MCG2600598.1 dTMP kinase [Achromobacter sp.]CAB3718562.1 Thymidylate kinase [Achromobacter insuavis]CAB3927239.1 Thymidylate kinase [Achromobacter insuavis]CUJ80391.1 Thymidylate kinase [Achromobacter sp. 2789STDY5608628]
MTSRGRFITLEGVDGAGKSTHTEWIAEFLRGQGLEVVSTREPGGTPLGEKLRALVLTDPMGLDTETLLMFAARCEHLHQVIEPALARGAWVVCDRYTDATYAYQGGGRGLGAARVAALETWMQAGRPDRTWLFDVPLAVARARLADAREPDRFEREGAAFFERTRTAYQARAAAEPDRIQVIDSTRAIPEIRAELEAGLRQLVAARP